MAKTNGIFKQDFILGQFQRDARSTSDNSAVAQAIRAGEANRLYRAQQEAKRANQPLMSPRKY
jgi:hypothetical protein